MKSKKLWIGILVVLLVVAFTVAAIARRPKEEDTIGGFKGGTRVKAEVVKKDDIQTRISSSGELEAKNTRTIYAESSNKIIRIHKKVGDVVKTGDLLLTLDQDTKEQTQKQIEVLKLKLSAAEEGLNIIVTGGTKKEILNAQSKLLQVEKTEQEAKDNLQAQKTNLENLERDLKNEKINYEIQNNLFREGLISQKEMDDAKTALSTLEQKMESTRTAILSAQKAIEAAALEKETSQYNLAVLLNQIDDPDKKQSITAKQSEIKDLQMQIFNAQKNFEKAGTEVLAPIDGVLIKAVEEEGMSITQGMELMTIIDPSKLMINCNISPYYAADLKAGLEVNIRYTGSKTVETVGKVTRVSPVAISSQNSTNNSSNNASIPIEIEIAEPGDVLRPGFTVDVKVITETRQNVSIIPLLATMEDDDSNAYVYVIGEDGTLEKRVVVEGLNNGLYIEVDNLEAGEIIVSNPAEFLKEGMKVSYEKTGDMQ